MKVYEIVWGYVTVYGYIVWCMGVYVPLWMYMKVYDGIWM